jgi:phenylpropionate dioxygenase-like ring-hydroxylating dioxygenase large terminal subunit
MEENVKELVDVEKGLVSRRIFIEPEIYQRELERIFARCWLYLGHESQLPEPGDYLTTTMGEDPVILCRDRGGRIRGLLNSCRHRGNKVCRTDQGRIGSFTCPYHGWTYDLDGRLIGVPGFKEWYHGDLDRDQWGLVPVAQIDVYQGLVFGTFDAEAPPLADALGDARWTMDMLLTRSGGGTEITGGAFKWTVNCNWKFAADNFIGDNYHSATTHKSAKIAGHHAQPGEAAGSYGRKGFSVITPQGHGYNVQLREEKGDGRIAAPDARQTYQSATIGETESRLGRFRAREVERFNCTIFPNLSISSSTGMLHVWHPRGPLKTEIWLFTVVDKHAPVDVKDQLRLAAQRHFSPAGLFEQDDIENWELSTLASLGAVARRYPLNYQMGLGHERPVRDGMAPDRFEGLVNEINQRGFYRRWAELMER